jgi:hypothetical protein
MEIAKGEGLAVALLATREFIDKLGVVAVEESYRILITNSVFNKSRNTNYDSQVILVEGYGCKMPAVQEYVALCVYTYKAFKKCLYGHDPITYGRSSTNEKSWPMVVGNFNHAIPRLAAPAGFSIYPDLLYYKGAEAVGAGGQRRV